MNCASLTSEHVSSDFSTFLAKAIPLSHVRPPESGIIVPAAAEIPPGLKVNDGAM